MSNKPSVSIIGYGRVGLPLARRLTSLGYSVTGTVTRKEKQQQLTTEGLDTHILSFSPQPDGDLSAVLSTDVLVVTVPPSMKAPHEYPVMMKALANAAAKNAVAKNAVAKNAVAKNAVAKNAVAKKGIQKVLLIATTSVYHQTGEVVHEEDATKDVPPFLGISWLEIEEIFSQRTEFKTTVVRFSGLMGRGINPGMYFAGRELKGANDPVNMIHVDDCVEIMAQIIEQNAWGNVFNASADEHPIKRDFYTKACESVGMPAPTFTDEPQPYRLVNCDKLKQHLGYTFKHPDPIAGLDH